MATATVVNPKTNESFQLDFYVAKSSQQSILGSQACQSMKLLTVNVEKILSLDNTTVTPLTMQKVLDNYGNVFEGYGKLEGTLHLETDPTVPPVRMPLRKLPYALRDRVKAELDAMEANGIIAPMNEPSEWISALLVATKKSGNLRICIDPKPLNKALMRNHYLMPTIEDVLPELNNAKVFSICDARHGFWHVCLDDASSRLTTFETPRGKKRFLRLGFGLSVAPEEFQRRLIDALSGLDGIACIADDILVYGNGDTRETAMADHDRKMHALLARCRERGIRLNKDKFKLHQESIAYMGHVLTQNGLQADPAKVEAIKNMPPPSDVKGVQRLIGMATFLAKFLPNFSEVTSPIRTLLDSKNEFRWDEHVHGKAFEELKTALQSKEVLRYYDCNKPIIIQCDASQHALGGVLLQEGRPVAYISRALTPTETNYSQIEKELLAVLFSMERLHTFVYGRKTEVHTDHRPLISIIKKPLTSAPGDFKECFCACKTTT